MRNTWILTAVLAAIVLSACGGKEDVAAKPIPVVINRPAPARGGTEGSGGEAGFRDQFFAAAAEQLDVTVAALTEALGTPPDFEAAAEKLGIAIDKLRDVVPQFGPGGFAGRGQIFARAAEALEITAEDLADALGSPPDFKAAAEKLKIPIEKLQEALPFSEGGGFGQRTQ